MIVLDTNVISEIMRADPSPTVLTWARAQDPGSIHTTAVNEAELLYGVAALPDGQRRVGLMRAVEVVFGSVLAGRVLPFDRQAARAYAEWAAACRRAGRAAGVADMQIAAIAMARGAAAIATRNGRDFAGCGVAVVDPWRT